MQRARRNGSTHEYSKRMAERENGRGCGGCGKERVKRVVARGEWRVGEWSVVSDEGEGGGADWRFV